MSLSGIACARGGRVLFAGLSLSLSAGDAVVISGPNGVGKSSLLRIAAGLLPPMAGSIGGAAARGYLGEAHALDAERTLAGALSFWARVDGVTAVPAAIDAALDMIGLAHIADIPVRFLSTGQRRRAALAPLLIARPPVWLLDEPASGLDVAAIDRLGDIIAHHRAQSGAVLVATHQPIAMPEAATLEMSPGMGLADHHDAEDAA